MKSVIIIILAIFLIAEGRAQPTAGTFELSFSPSFSSYKPREAKESYETVNIPVRVGYFLNRNLELEPELWLTIPDESQYTGMTFSANVCWNFVGASKTVPFILAGIGYGNGYQFLNVASDQETGIFVYGFGAGVKIFLNPHVGIRTEYRFRHYSGSKEVQIWGDSLKRDLGLTSHDFLIGFSMYFPKGNKREAGK